MTKFAITVFVSILSMSAHANVLFETCEHVSEMAVLAKDNIPYWTNNRNSNVKNCYSDIKEFLTVATPEDIAQFNAEYAGQIEIFTNDTDFSQFVASKKSEGQTFVLPTTTNTSLTPVIRPTTTSSFFKN